MTSPLNTFSSEDYVFRTERIKRIYKATISVHKTIISIYFCGGKYYGVTYTIIKKENWTFFANKKLSPLDFDFF